MPARPRRVVVLAVVVAAVVAGCADGTEDETEAAASPSATVAAPVGADDGIQATGRLDGSPVAISRGAPIVIVGDCDPTDGAADEDLCIRARTIDGLEVALVVENRDALVAGSTVEVGRASCLDGCDGITDVVIARLVVGDESIEVTGGSFDVAEAGPRWVADFTLELPFGDSLRGSFDVAERLPEENPDGVLRPAEEATG